MSLIEHGSFTLHSGATSDWRLNLEALAPEDWDALAAIIAGRAKPFGAVEGVPRGGLPLSTRLERYRTPGAGLLIVDDVRTAGTSMEAQRAGREAQGWVVFARGPLPPWVQALFLATDGWGTER